MKAMHALCFWLTDCIQWTGCVSLCDWHVQIARACHAVVTCCTEDGTLYIQPLWAEPGASAALQQRLLHGVPVCVCVCFVHEACMWCSSTGVCMWCKAAEAAIEPVGEHQQAKRALVQVPFLQDCFDSGRD